MIVKSFPHAHEVDPIATQLVVCKSNSLVDQVVGVAEELVELYPELYRQMYRVVLHLVFIVMRVPVVK